MSSGVCVGKAIPHDLNQLLTLRNNFFAIKRPFFRERAEQVWCFIHRQFSWALQREQTDLVPE